MRSRLVGAAGRGGAKMAAAVSVSGAGPGAEPPAGPPRAPEEALPPLEPAEIRSRLEHSERQFRNRRKVLIRGLPADVSNQDVHELLKDFELKYCFVDRHKGTAFVTLQDSAQASAALRRLQGCSLRGRALRPQLQPPDAVLCVANLPRLLSQRRFQDLLRPFGSLERCFLVYSPTTGHSKGYGFVEFMKRESAARARAELAGRRLGGRALWVHWSDAAQRGPERLHSRCLRVDGLPAGCGDARELHRMAAETCEPQFCQVAVGQDGRPLGFAVLELPSPEAAERVQGALDGAALGGSRLRAAFCAPGPAGAGSLAALIAAQAMAQNRGKGLLPEPSALQILSSLGNPASLQLLLGGRGLLGAAPALPLVPNPALPALLQLALHNLPQKPGILGDSPRSPRPHGLAQPPTGVPPAGPDRDKAGPGTPRTPPGPPGRGPKGKQGENGAPPVSLLGEPPQDLRPPLNPYLNLRSLLPPPPPGQGFGVNGGVLGTPRAEPPLLPTPRLALEFPKDLGSRIFPQTRGDPSGSILGGFGHGSHKNFEAGNSPGVDRGSLGPPLLSGSPRSCFSSGLRAGLQQSQLGKSVAVPPSSDPVLPLAAPAVHLKTPLGAQKRSCWRLLPAPERSPEGAYVGQHSQGLGGHYADSHLKRRRVL